MPALRAAPPAPLSTAPRALLQPPRGPATNPAHCWAPDHGACKLPRPAARRLVAAAAAGTAPAVAAAASSEPAQPAQPSLLRRLGAFLATNYLPCGLLTAVVLG